MIPKRGEGGNSVSVDMPANKRHRAAAQSAHLHRSSSSPSLPTPAHQCHCIDEEGFTSPQTASLHRSNLSPATQHTPNEATYKISHPSSRPPHPALHNKERETESAWGFMASPPAFSPLSHHSDHSASSRHDSQAQSLRFRNFSPDPDGCAGRARIFVASRGRWFSSVADAVEHAAPGEDIALAPGVYTEMRPIVLHADGIVLRAEGETSDSEDMELDDNDGAAGGGQAAGCGERGGEGGPRVRLVCRGSEPHALVCRGWGVRVLGIQIMQEDTERGGDQAAEEAEATEPAREAERAAGGEVVEGNAATEEGGRMAGDDVDRCCVSVAEGDAEVRRCVLSSVGGYGVMVWGLASPRLEGCVLTGCRHAAAICGGYSRAAFARNDVQGNSGFGVVVVDCAGGRFTDNRIRGNGKCGVVCAGRSEAVFEGNEVADGAQGGFWLRDESRCVIAKSSVRGNARVGVQVSDQSDPLVEGNEIRGGRNGGVVVHDQARGRFVGNEVVDNAHSGIGVMDSAAPLFVGNRLAGNRAGGAVMAGSATAVLSDNVVTGNGFAGVGLKEGARPVLLDNKICDNRGYGVLVHGQSRCEMAGCLLEGNDGSALCASGASRVAIRNSTVRGGEGERGERTGVQVQDSAEVEARDCVVTGHAGCNVFCRDEGSLRVVAGFVSHAGGAGLVLQGRCRATLEGVQVCENRVGNVVALEQAQLRMVRGGVADSRGVGVMVSAGARAELRGVAVSGNGGAGVFGTRGGELRVSGCRVRGSGGGGVVMEGGGVGEVVGSVVWENGCGGGVAAVAGARVSVQRSVVMGGRGDGAGVEAMRHGLGLVAGGGVERGREGGEEDNDSSMGEASEGGAEGRGGFGGAGGGCEGGGVEYEGCVLEEGVVGAGGHRGDAEEDQASKTAAARNNRIVTADQREEAVEWGLEELDRYGQLGGGGEAGEDAVVRRRGVVVRMVGGGVMIGRDESR